MGPVDRAECAALAIDGGNQQRRFRPRGYVLGELRHPLVFGHRLRLQRDSTDLRAPFGRHLFERSPELECLNHVRRIGRHIVAGRAFALRLLVQEFTGVATARDLRANDRARRRADDEVGVAHVDAALE